MAALFLLFVCGFIGMEILSYFLHRFVFHGLFWSIHKSHHLPSKGKFELNDLFAFFFGSLSILMILFGLVYSIPELTAPGLGIAVYGMAYFILHDICTHRRFFKKVRKPRWAEHIIKSHQIHHRSIDKTGIEPFGLFWTYSSRLKNKRKIKKH